MGIRVGEDWPTRISKAQTGLYQLMKEFLEQGKSAFFKSDILVVDSVRYMYDEDQKAPVIVPR